MILLALTRLKNKDMKAYTDIEQGKELSFILPIDTADMHYQYVLPWSSTLHSVPSIGNPSEALKWYNMGYEKTGQPPMELRDFCVPCWSLAALIEVLPLGLDIHNISDGHKTYYYVEVYTKEIYMKLKRMNKAEICLSTERHENLVDACVEMIFTLKERNLL